jgi:hypothetical protein
MKILTTVALSIGLRTASQAMERPSFHMKGTPTGKPTGALKPGEYWWHPEISPQGPLMLLVSVPEQTIHVYRNGVQGRPVEADDIASRIRFNREFAQKLVDEIKPGTTVIVTDQPVVRNPKADSTYFAAN